MSVTRMYLVLLAAATVVGCLLHLLVTGGAAFSSALGIGETVGRIVALFLFAALVPTVIVLLSRKPIASVATPTAVGMFVLAILAYSSFSVLEFQRTVASSTLPPVASQPFSPPGCEFAVAFPSKPRITSLIVPGFGEVPEAEISDDRGLMRANCVSVSAGRSIPYYGDRSGLLQILQAYANENGVGNVTYTYETIDLGIRARARGTKQLKDRWLTFETVWFVSPQSVMSLSAAGFSESYPTREIAEFLNSVTHVGN